jgi:hypothetical protein
MARGQPYMRALNVLSVLLGVLGALIVIIDLYSEFQNGVPIDIGILTSGGALLAVGVTGLFVVTGLVKLEKRLEELEKRESGAHRR